MSLWRPRRPAPAEPHGRSVWPAVPLGAAVGTTTGSYTEVDLSAAEAARQSVAVYSATDLIASIGSELPLDTYRGRGEDKRQLTTPWWLDDPDGSGHGRQDWSYRVLMSWLLRGNLYGDILERTPAGVLRQVALLHPDLVSGWLGSDGTVHWSVNGRDYTDTGTFLHRRVNPVPGYVQGLSPVAMLATQVGLSIAVTRFGRQWFTDGAHPSAMLTNTEASLTKPQADEAKSRFMATLYGTRDPVVLGKGWEYKSLQIPPEDSQFLQTAGMSEAQCCRIFGPGIAEILGYESGGSLTYSNIQDRGVHLLQYTVNRWLLRLERLLSQFLPAPQYVLFNRDAILQTSTMQRYLAHASALDKRWRTVNEVRQLEDLPPVPWGDEPNTPGAPASFQQGSAT